MPFKLKLKKSRQYNVSSKSLFVISVHHLLVFDTPTTVDCTLSSESTGLECLSNVCQRLSINQLEFFGLRYVVKGSTKNDGEELRWVDLERPLSRQLDKYAASPRLYLRVMYYVISGVSLINDEVTRNYYFLQLKSDIVEGRISCDPKQAVILAMYCRQAQYDSHQNERHTVEYLKNLLPFPPSAIEAGHSLETLTEAVLQPNAEIQNLTQAMAEGLFITACQQLDGYGQEKFDAKDDCSAEVTLGITVSGIAVSANENSKFYPWHEISNVVNHKRTFNIECTEPDKSVGFNLCDTETGRYFWKLCVLQHTFYIKYEKNQNHSMPEGNFNLFQNLPDDLTESKDNLFVEQPNLYASDSHISAGNWQTDSVVSSNMSLAQSQQQLKQQFNQNWVTPMMADNYTTRNSNWGLVGSNASLNNRAQSSSCLDLSNNNISSHDKERLKAFLPGYRSAPDYETAVQQKYRASESELRMNNMVHLQPPAGVVSDNHLNVNNYSGSQPDVHRVTAVADAIFGQQLQYPDVTQTTNNVYQQHFDPNVVRNMDGLSQQLQMMRFNKPPPPYPANRLSSTSTPDLALASHRALAYQAYVSGSSPDLVSTRTFLNSQYQGPQQPSIPSNTFRYRCSQSHIPHGTYENLNLNFPENQTKTNLLSQKIQKAYDAAYRVPNQQPAGLIGSHQLNGSIDPIEPIYENINVPLPNPTDAITNSEMRDRASSVQSAPGVMRFKQQQQQSPHQHQSNPTTQQQHQSQQAILNDTHNFNVTKPAIFFDRQPEHVPVTKAQSNPIVVQHQVLQNSQSQDTTDNHPSVAIHQQQTSRKSTTPVEQNSRLNRSYPQFDSLNRSQSTNVLDSSQSSSYTNTTTTTDSGINCSEHRNSKEKKKRRWNFWSGGSKGSLSDKQKSATLGRDKEKSSMNALTKDEESNLRHRWSTGLPRLPLLATISKEKLCQILETKLSDPQLYVEFERIPKRKENARYDCALHEENRMKNFDPNFLPYDDNRVRLTPTRDNRLGYYNASNITATVGAKQRFYIVAQSPSGVPALSTFLQCVWEADVYLLVQLSDEVNYVPPTSDKCLEYGQYQIWQEFSQVTDRCVTSKLRIYHTQSRRYRSVWHLRYCEWVEQNCPKDVGQFLEFLEELSSVRLASINEVPPGHNTNPPVLIHCSEGGGRAGVTLTADLLLYTMDHNQDLDIPRVLSQLRQQRDNIVPSLAQYKFVYALLINYLKRTRLI